MDNFEALDAKNAAISLPDGWAWATAAVPSNTPGLLWIDYDGRVIRGAPCGPTPIGDEDGWPGTFGGRRGWVRPLRECRAPPGWYVTFEHDTAVAWTGFQFVTPDDAQYGEPIVPDDASCWQWVADADERRRREAIADSSDARRMHYPRGIAPISLDPAEVSTEHALLRRYFSPATDNPAPPADPREKRQWFEAQHPEFFVPTPGERTVADVQGVGISARGTPLELEYDFEGDDVGVDVTNAEAAEWRRKGGCE